MSVAATNARTYDLSTFRLDRILNNNTKSKTICVLGKFPNGDLINPAIVVFEKTAFTASDVHTINDDDNDDNGLNDDDDDNKDGDIKRTFFSSDTQLKIEFLNDIYGNFECFPKPEINSNCFSYYTLPFIP